MSKEDEQAFIKKEETKENSTKMSKKQWFVLLCLYILYVLAGTGIFFFVESAEEQKKASIDIEERKNLENLIREHFQGNYSSRKLLFQDLTEYCGKPLGFTMSEEPYVYKWDFYHSLFFVITVVSTIGYGNLAPTLMSTRLFMIFYSLLGIPMHGLVIFSLGEFFAKSFRKLYRRWKKSKIEAKLDYDAAKLGLISQVILYLIPGFTFFIFLPATIITVFEGWQYYESVYFSFVTLTTIGFGDFVTGVSDSSDFGMLYTVYQIFLLVWIIGGLGYLSMILTFITSGMTSKRVRKIEHMLSENIKNTPKKIRSELRTLLQELLFLKVKPVYKGEFEYLPNIIERSQSSPDLTMYNKESPTMVRKRALSECYRAITFQKVQSDTDLNRIDIDRTFPPNNDLFDQTGLLFRVVNALSNESLQREDEREVGIHGFSDTNILASEYFEPSITKSTCKKRRAISDIRSPKMLLHEAINGNTWYGADAEQAITQYNKRQRAKSVFEIKKSDNETLFKKIRNRLLSRDESNNDPEKQNISSEMEYNRTETIPNVATRRGSVLSSAHEQILEQTSIAAFIRALSAVANSEQLQDTESCSATASPRSRRHAIGAMPHSRRSSLAPYFPPPEVNTRRRFSLRPSDENLLKDSVKWKDKKRKISVTFQDERRNSLRLEASSSIPPTVQENVLYSQSPGSQDDTRRRKVSINIPVGGQQPKEEPPPYSALPSGPQRKFSIRPVHLGSSVASPVQKQMQKRDRTDSGSSRL